MNNLRTSLFCFVLALPLALGALVPSQGLRANPAAFVSVVADLPLMAGLEEDASAAVVFETASGRIAQAVASGEVEAHRVREYYAATLPELGWHLETLDRYRREGELLALEITTDKARPGWVDVHFRLAPATP